MEGTKRGEVERRWREPEIVDLEEEEETMEGEDLTILFEKLDDDVKIVKEIRTIDSSDDEDEVMVLEVLGIPGGERDTSVGSEVEGIPPSSGSELSGYDGVEEEGGRTKRPFSQVAATAAVKVTSSSASAQVDSEEILEEGGAPAPETLISFNEDDWPPLEPFSEACSPPSSPGSVPESQVENGEDVEGTLAKTMDLEGNKVDEDIETGNGGDAPLQSSEVKSTDEKGHSEIDNLEEKEETDALVPPEVVHLEREDLCSWDTQEAVSSFCSSFLQAFEDLQREEEEEKEAKKKAKLKQKEDQKKAHERLLQNLEENGRKRTRLGTRAAQVPERPPPSPPPPPPPLKRAPMAKRPAKMERKRKVCEGATPTTLMNFVGPPPLSRRPSCSKNTAQRVTPPNRMGKEMGWVKGEEWEVWRILDARLEKNSRGQQRIKYMVRWKGWNKSNDAWVKLKDLNAEKKMGRFWGNILKKVKVKNGCIEKPVRIGQPEDKTYFY